MLYARMSYTPDIITGSGLSAFMKYVWREGLIFRSQGKTTKRDLIYSETLKMISSMAANIPSAATKMKILKEFIEIGDQKRRDPKSWDLNRGRVVVPVNQIGFQVHFRLGFAGKRRTCRVALDARQYCIVAASVK
mmetsp:Transcript_23905/g.40760  ORF Transcript_23905/g.40760 Transcript_23905/m.40760 type:complete len:135 (-) Transcript_23905:157-561(-)